LIVEAATIGQRTMLDRDWKWSAKPWISDDNVFVSRGEGIPKKLGKDS
jgi:hypothetical protein